MINRSLCVLHFFLLLLCPAQIRDTLKWQTYRTQVLLNQSNLQYRSLQPPKIRLPRILSSCLLAVCFRTKIFIRFFLLRSILIKDSSADSITCSCVASRAHNKPGEKGTASTFPDFSAFSSFLRGNKLNLRREKIEGVIASILWPQRMGGRESSSSVLECEIHLSENNYYGLCKRREAGTWAGQGQLQVLGHERTKAFKSLLLRALKTISHLFFFSEFSLL